MDENAENSTVMMVMMVVTMTPVVAMVSSARFYYNSLPVRCGLVVRRIGGRVVLCQ